VPVIFSSISSGLDGAISKGLFRRTATQVSADEALILVDSAELLAAQGIEKSRLQEVRVRDLACVLPVVGLARWMFDEWF